LSFAQARETISRGMRDIGENAKRIQKIVDNLKHLGKQDRGHMDEAGRHRKILQAVVTLLEARIRKHTDVFPLDLPEALPMVRGNVQQLEQVFINVIVNALESLPDRSRSVRVSAELGQGPEHGSSSSVADQGKGSPRMSWRRSANPSLPPRPTAAAPVWACRSRRRSSKNTAGYCASQSNDDLGTTVSIDLPISHGGVNEGKVVCQSAGLSRR
jgi:nitrogen fixation/metabolism regulation signal transduction histidine kinase